MLQLSFTLMHQVAVKILKVMNWFKRSNSSVVQEILIQWRNKLARGPSTFTWKFPTMGILVSILDHHAFAKCLKEDNKKLHFVCIACQPNSHKYLFICFRIIRPLELFTKTNCYDGERLAFQWGEETKLLIRIGVGMENY